MRFNALLPLEGIKAMLEVVERSNFTEGQGVFESQFTDGIAIATFENGEIFLTVKFIDTSAGIGVMKVDIPQQALV